MEHWGSGFREPRVFFEPQPKRGSPEGTRDKILQSSLRTFG